MSDPKYAHVGPVETRLMEECAEVIKAVSKAVRFGFDDWHPDTPGVTNRWKLLQEMEDVVLRWNELANREGLPRLGLLPSLPKVTT